MAKYRLNSMGELARQLEFAPQEQRSAQIANAEDLLHLIDPAKAYPLDFIIFKITGYKPKKVGPDLLTGLALQHDLGLLIEHVSETMTVPTVSLSEPVLSIGDVTERFNVTSKTIQRWRRRGLPARRFIFPDNKRRVGFLLSSVEKFLAGHREQVTRGTNFSLVDDGERDVIIRRARRLATRCHCCVGEITRRIARKLNRSPLTILHTVRKYDQEHAGAAVFENAEAPMDGDKRAAVVKGYRRGLSLASMSRRMGVPRTAIYRVVLEERVAWLQRRKVRFHDDVLFHSPSAGTTIEAINNQDALAPDKTDGESRIPRDLPPYLAQLYRTPLLTPAQERSLFLKLNFHKFQFVSARRKLDPLMARRRDLDAMESALRLANDTKNRIVRANLRLVVSVARKHMRPGLSLMELVSDGNITLMRAVDGFDVNRGHRFSTYATLALMKGFARSVPQMQAGLRGGADVNALSDLPDRRGDDAKEQWLNREEVGQLLAALDERERSVMLAYYGLENDAAPATFEQVGARMGLSKGRVRQIQRDALRKLRDAAGVEVG